MTVCNRCGKENQDHYKFCLGCGAELTVAPKGSGDVGMMKTMMADPGSGGPDAAATADGRPVTWVWTGSRSPDGRRDGDAACRSARRTADAAAADGPAAGRPRLLAWLRTTGRCRRDAP